jgi:hypothetical protein
MLFRVALGAVLFLGAIGGWIIAAGPSFMTGATTGNYFAAEGSGRPVGFVCKTFGPNGELLPCSPEAYERTRRRLEEDLAGFDAMASEGDTLSADETAEAPPIEASSDE